MSELALHGIKKISINHEFCKSTGDYQEFSTIQIEVFADDKNVKRFLFKLFITPDTEISFAGLLAFQRGMEPKKNEPVEEDMLSTANPFPDEVKKEDENDRSE